MSAFPGSEPEDAAQARLDRPPVLPPAIEACAAARTERPNSCAGGPAEREKIRFACETRWSVVDFLRDAALERSLPLYRNLPQHHRIEPQLVRHRRDGLASVYTAAIEETGEDSPILDCLRPDTRHVEAILKGRSALADTRIACVAPGFSATKLSSYARNGMTFATGPVSLTPLLNANLCITYGAEGTMLRFLLAGVPQLVSPRHVESYMAVRRLAANGSGVSFPAKVSAAEVAGMIRRCREERAMLASSMAFAGRQSTQNSTSGLSEVVAALRLGI